MGPVPPDPNDPDLWPEWDEEDEEWSPRRQWSTTSRIVALVVLVAFVLVYALGMR
jgi:hypothetical protein